MGNRCLNSSNLKKQIFTDLSKYIPLIHRTEKLYAPLVPLCQVLYHFDKNQLIFNQDLFQYQFIHSQAKSRQVVFVPISFLSITPL